MVDVERPSHHVRRLLIACLLLAGCGSPQDPDRQTPTPQKLWPTPVRYEVDARWEQNRLEGRMLLALRNGGPDTLDHVWMRTWPNALASCRRPLATLTPSVEAKEGCTAQRVPLDPPLEPGGEATLRMAFSVDVPAGADRLGRSKDVAYLGNALPTLAVADEDGWRLPPYFDQGEAWFTLSAHWQVRLDVPDGLTVATTGARTGPDAYEAERARDFMIVIGRLRTVSERVGDITVRHFRLPGAPDSHAQRALGAAKAALRAFTGWYGPWGRRELDIVQGPAEIATRGIAMEYPELILTPPAGAAVAHEIAHQWWAFLMGNDPYREPFLDEGFAEYSAARLPRSVTGGDRLRGCHPPDEPPDPPISADVPALQEAGGRAYVRTAYIGGACFLRRLERRLGRARFDRMLRGLVAEHREQTWTRADLIRAIERAAAGTFDVDDFLKREAVTRPGR